MADLVVGGKEKLRLTIFSRSVGIIQAQTYETREELVNKFFPEREHVIYFQGISDTDDPVDHYFDRGGVGDIAGIAMAKMVTRQIMPVQVQARGR